MGSFSANSVMEEIHEDRANRLPQEMNIVLTESTIYFIITASLVLHGIAHAIALIGLLFQSLGIGTTSRVQLRSWILRSLSARTTALLAIPFWLVSTLGFIGSGISYWGASFQNLNWSLLAVEGAILSTLGILLFSGKWPGSKSTRQSWFNTAIAMFMNVVILVTQLWLKWPG
jgi:hypothetical protein